LVGVDLLVAKEEGVKNLAKPRDVIYGWPLCISAGLFVIATSFEYKQQTLVGFLDISGAYDSVLIMIYSAIKCIR
jgi:hypothetical protein